MVNATNPDFSYRPPSSGWDKPPNFSDRHERPTGVTIIAIFNFIGTGLYALILLVAILTPSMVIQQPISSGQDEQFAGFLQRLEEAQTTRLICTSLVVVPFGLAVGIGLWRLHSWARTLALFIYGAGTILSLLLNFSTPLTGASLVGILVSASAFIYLLRPDVRAAFGEEVYV